MLFTGLTLPYELMLITYNYDDFEMKMAFNLGYIFAKKVNLFCTPTFIIFIRNSNHFKANIFLIPGWKIKTLRVHGYFGYKRIFFY